MTRPVTAETLSDEMVREMIALWSSERDKLDARPSVAGEAARDAYRKSVEYNFNIRHARVALGEKRARKGGSRKESRERIVAAINARNGGGR